MPREGYRTISVTEDVYELLNNLKKKYGIRGIELIRRSLILFDKIMEGLKEIESED